MRRTLALSTLLLVACGEPAHKATRDMVQSADFPPAPTTLTTPSKRCADRWIPLAAGLEYRAFRCGEEERPDFHLLRVDPTSVRLRVVMKKGGHAREVTASDGATFAMNANFFDEHDDPLGLVFDGGKRIHPLRAVSWMSVFMIDVRGRARIIPSGRWNRHRAEAALALQAGPRLVAHGEVSRLKPAGPSRRSGVCIEPDGRVILFVTEGDRFFTPDETAAAMTNHHEGALGCEEAMLFDGGGSAQLHLDHPPITVSVPGDAVPVFLAGGENRRP